MDDKKQASEAIAPQKIYKYESDDRQILVNFLREYSEKLLFICYELDIKIERSSIRSRLSRFIYKTFEVDANVLSSLALTGSFLLLDIFIYSRYKNFTFGTFTSSDITIAVLLYIVMMFAGFTWVISANTLVEDYPAIARSRSLLEKDARSMADKLEKVMRVTIEIQDQIEVNIARKLELDLRITDTESALKYYYLIVEGKF
ncbi:hypothetical protein [Chamaesiphon polymorphus]|uniref:Uncharacterized protein n=1 Tax=Chamaesiphon polymorphus CCALA 037 TaxID=2107692 RepID=A0A2T1GJM5_9CYAN|nr:hypothetical protein [Chamaesiphon polymorphus]PSB57998.1 hypothetical protein C7B77_06420 [Chamaesiphon polymorphus CCALA 037]